MKWWFHGSVEKIEKFDEFFVAMTSTFSRNNSCKCMQNNTVRPM